MAGSSPLRARTATGPGKRFRWLSAARPRVARDTAVLVLTLLLARYAGGDPFAADGRGGGTTTGAERVLEEAPRGALTAAMVLAAVFAALVIAVWPDPLGGREGHTLRFAAPVRRAALGSASAGAARFVRDGEGRAGTWGIDRRGVWVGVEGGVFRMVAAGDRRQQGARAAEYARARPPPAA